MDWGYKAVLTGMSVAAVLMAAHLLGRRVAGLIAGLPVITAPSLLWIAADRDAAYAAHCAVGSVAAAGAAAMFALVYERLARRRGVMASLGGALAVGGLTALGLAHLTGGAHGLAVAVIATALLCGIALLALPAAARTAAPAHPLRGEILLAAAIAGTVSAAIAAGTAWLGPFWSGLLAAMPLMSTCVLVHQHLTAPHPDRQRFLRGYAAGLIGKAGFAGTFAALAAPLGAAAATGLSLGVGLTVSLLVARGLARAEAAAAVAGPRLAPLA